MPDEEVHSHEDNDETWELIRANLGPAEDYVVGPREQEALHG